MPAALLLPTMPRSARWIVPTLLACSVPFLVLAMMSALAWAASLFHEPGPIHDASRVADEFVFFPLAALVMVGIWAVLGFSLLVGAWKLVQRIIRHASADDSEPPSR